MLRAVTSHVSCLYLLYTPSSSNQKQHILNAADDFFAGILILCIYIKVLEKCTKNLIAHSRLAFNDH